MVVFWNVTSLCWRQLSFSDASVSIYQTTRRGIPEDRHLRYIRVDSTRLSLGQNIHFLQIPLFALTKFSVVPETGPHGTPWLFLPSVVSVHTVLHSTSHLVIASRPYIRPTFLRLVTRTVNSCSQALPRLQLRSVINLLNKRKVVKYYHIVQFIRN
jgi:hypothetical protein